MTRLVLPSQSTIKMDKGYYSTLNLGLMKEIYIVVAIHNKNGQGLLQAVIPPAIKEVVMSQSTIKMDKGYYCY